MRSDEWNAVPKSVLGRAGLVLDAFISSERTLRLSEIVSQTGLPKATAHRLVAELVELDFLRREGHVFQLGTRLFELGELVPERRSLREIALPYVEDLYESLHETVHLGVPSGTEVLYIEKIEGHRRIAAPSRIAGRMPTYCTAIGKVILAFSPRAVLEEVLQSPLPPRTGYTVVQPTRLLDELRVVVLEGVAVEREESALGICCAAAPIFDHRGQVAAAISIAAPIQRRDPTELTAPARKAGLAITQAIGGRMPRR